MKLFSEYVDRPDDAGHSSGAITDRYIDIELRERHRSARKKLFPMKIS